MSLQIRLRDVSVNYDSPLGGPEVAALSQVNLDIAPGEFVVALGASGCGKTTLLNLMAGFVAPSQGIVTMAASRAAQTQFEPITGPGVERGVVFQRHALMPWLDVMDNVALGLRFKRLTRAARVQRAMDSLRQVDLEGFDKHAVHQLSGGMQQRVGIARALANDPAMLLMDEPFGALDFRTRQALQTLILNIWEATRKTVFFITHDIDEALLLGTRLLILSPRPGRVIRDIPLDFGRCSLRSANPREVRVSASFLAMREQVLDLIEREHEVSHETC